MISEAVFLRDLESKDSVNSGADVELPGGGSHGALYQLFLLVTICL